MSKLNELQQRLDEVEELPEGGGLPPAGASQEGGSGELQLDGGAVGQVTSPAIPQPEGGAGGGVLLSASLPALGLYRPDHPLFIVPTRAEERPVRGAPTLDSVCPPAVQVYHNLDRVRQPADFLWDLVVERRVVEERRRQL